MVKQRTLVTVAVLFLALYTAYFFVDNIRNLFTFNYPFKDLPTRPSEQRQGHHQRLASSILQLQRQIQLAAGRGDVTQAVWASRLLLVAAELDPRVLLDTPANSNYDNREHHVCSEIYLGKQADYKLQNNFIIDNCSTSTNFHEVLTVMISAKNWTLNRINSVVQSFQSIYDVPIIVLTYGSGKLQSFPSGNVQQKDFAQETHDSVAINRVASLVSTPFVLITDSLTHSSQNSSLERLVRVLDQVTNVDVVAGAYRSESGLWNYGCLQNKMENYQLAYTQGYEHSHEGCMFCDAVLGPFVARTKLLHNIPMDEDLDGPVAFQHWFMKLSLKDSLLMSCPDVMFFVQEEPKMARQDWLAVATKWSLQTIYSYDGETFEFSCEEVQIVCRNLMSTVASFLLPPCCRQKMRQVLANFQDCAEQSSVNYELKVGSLLGAVKMDGILPWDFDLDVGFDCKELDQMDMEVDKCMSSKGCSKKQISVSYRAYDCQTYSIDIVCRHFSPSAFLPLQYQHVPTKVNYQGRETTVGSNPGLVARNVYGQNYLKHAVHWRHSGGSHTEGKWKPCSYPGHHACIDAMPVDGNIRFRKLTTQPP